MRAEKRKRADRPPRAVEPDAAPPDLRMLSDAEIRHEADDRLGFKPYADALAALIDNPATGTPLTIAINAPWGSGKSSLGRMVQTRLEGKAAAGGDQPHVTTWFDAWMHDDAQNLATAFAAHLAQEAERRRPLRYRLTFPIPPGLRSPTERRRRRLGIVLMIGLTAWLASLVISRLVEPETLAGLLGETTRKFLEQSERWVGVWFLVVATALALLRVLTEVARTVRDFVRDPEAAAATGSMPQVRAELAALIQQATPRGSRFVVFIDDLERCRPPGAVDLLEVVNQLLPQASVVTVVMADLPAVGASAAVKYEKLAELYQPNGGVGADPLDGLDRRSVYGRLYLQKIVQLQFDLPVHPPERVRAFVTGLVRESATGPVMTETGLPRLTVWRFAVSVFSGLRHRRDLAAMELLRARARQYRQAGNLLGSVLGLLFTDWQVVGGRLIDRVAARPTLRLRKADSFDTVGGLVLVSVVWSAIFVFQSERPGWWLVIPAAMVVSSLLLAVLEVAHRRKEVRVTRDVRRFFDQQIATLQTQGVRVEDVDRDQLLRAGEQEFPAIQEGLKELLDERVRLLLTSESELMSEAQAAMMRFLPPLPRSAKRLVNQLRLLLVIAHERQLFTGAGHLTPGHIGKWAVLRERWPDLAQALVATPDAMRELESRTLDATAFAERLRLLAPFEIREAALREFCSEGVRLGGVLKRLVRFDARVGSQLRV